MKVALVGNQNCGKTTLFNALTGSNQKVGNWPGVTIEKKEGKILKTNIDIVDLPGVYSLSPYTAEEIITRNYILNEKPDVIINLIDSTCMERSLYLTLQLLELDCKVVIALNMLDFLEKKGFKIDPKKMEQRLGVSVVEVSAVKKTGIDELISQVQKTQNKNNNIEIYTKIVENQLKFAEKSLKIQNKRFSVVKCIEKDEDFIFLENPEIAHTRNVIGKIFQQDVSEIFASQRFETIQKIKKDCLKKVRDNVEVSTKIDKIILNRWLAVPIFIFAMSLVYFLSVGFVGGLTSSFVAGWIESIKNFFEIKLGSFGASDWAISLICDGVISGVGSVLVFLPELVVLFLCICLLETTGYMSRVAFIFDKIFRTFGLSGKSLIPFIVGTGCSVPAIATCRAIESENEKQMTIMLTPFVPCSAKLPIIALFASFFFPARRALVSISLYFFAIISIVISALVLKKFIFKAKDNSFISELPEYKKPNFKYVFRDVFDKIKGFIFRAGTIIFVCSIIVWFLSSFDWKFHYGLQIQNSILAWIGNLFGWFFYPILGEWNWAASVSALQGLVAKEQVVSSMTVLAGVAGENLNSIFLSPLFSGFCKASAYSFIVFNLFSAPCLGAISAMKNEFHSSKKVLGAVSFQIGFAWIISSLTFAILKFVFGVA